VLRRLVRASTIVLAATLGACASPPVAGPAVEHGACVPGEHEVAFFEHASFEGRCALLTVGDHVRPQELGLGNDTVSSVRVGAAVRLLACTDRAFGGSCTYLSGAVPSLDVVPLGNDALSSARVEKDPIGCVPQAQQIALYTEREFGGDCYVLGIGDYALPNATGLANDTVSSIRVGPGAQALVCQDGEWGEPCEQLSTDAGDLGPHRIGDNALSSARVLPPGGCVVRGADSRHAPHAPLVAQRCARSYQRILDLLATDSPVTLPIVISFTRLERFTAEVRGRELLIDEERWAPSDLGVLEHELTHVVTRYANTPEWLTEGVADFVRATLDESNGWEGVGCKGAETYEAGYQCAATLLRFAEQSATGAVRRLNQRLRTVPFDGTIDGRPVDALWRECQASLCAGR
jgi:hypothetical protein